MRIISVGKSALSVPWGRVFGIFIIEFVWEYFLKSKNWKTFKNLPVCYSQDSQERIHAFFTRDFEKNKLRYKPSFRQKSVTSTRTYNFDDTRHFDINPLFRQTHHFDKKPSFRQKSSIQEKSSFWSKSEVFFFLFLFPSLQNLTWIVLIVPRLIFLFEFPVTIGFLAILTPGRQGTGSTKKIIKK